MDVDWQERWQTNKIGFHQEKVNSRLIKYWGQLSPQKDTEVFVPLCGKTRDMIWLNEAGCKVIGIELSEIACRDFFIENKLKFTESRNGKFTAFTGESIQLLQGDFFDLTPGDLEDTTCVFDRASLIALPPKLRKQYVEHMARILPANSKTLLISMAYDQSKMNGPPYSVTEEEVRELYSSAFDLQVISQSSGPDIVGNLKDRGLDTLEETVYLLERLNT